MDYLAELTIVKRGDSNNEPEVRAEVQVKGPMPLVEAVLKEFADNLHWTEDQDEAKDAPQERYCAGCNSGDLRRAAHNHSLDT